MIIFRSFSGTMGVISFTQVITASVTCSMVKGYPSGFFADEASMVMVTWKIPFT